MLDEARRETLVQVLAHEHPRSAEQAWPLVRNITPAIAAAAGSSCDSCSTICADFPAELERQRHHPPCAERHHGRADRTRAGKRDVGDVLVRDQRLAGRREPVDDVERARREPRLDAEAGQLGRHERAPLRRLDDDCVAGRERRGDAARDLLQREVERHDHRADAPRLPERVVEEPAAERDRLAAELVRDAGVELEVPRGHLRVAASEGGRDSRVGGLERRELARAPANRRCDPKQHAATLARRRRTPCTRVRGARALDRLGHELRSGCLHGDERLAGRRVVNVPLLAAAARDDPAADERRVRDGGHQASRARMSSRSGVRKDLNRSGFSDIGKWPSPSISV